MPKVSFIVPVYNIPEDFLRQCLDSLSAQTNPDWEAILVDDGSRDASGAICDEYAAADGRFRVVHQQNAGVSAARNTGVVQAKGERITFLDADDWVDDNLCELIGDCNADADIVMFGYVLEYPDESMLSGLLDGQTVFQTAEDKLNLQRYVLCPQTAPGGEYSPGFVCCKAYRRAFFSGHALHFDTEMALCEDMVLSLLALESAGYVQMIPHRLYHYRQRPVSASAKNRYRPNVGKQVEQAMCAFMEFAQSTGKMAQLQMELLICGMYLFGLYLNQGPYNKESGLQAKARRAQAKHLLRSEAFSILRSREAASLASLQSRIKLLLFRRSFFGLFLQLQKKNDNNSVRQAEGTGNGA